MRAWSLALLAFLAVSPPLAAQEPAETELRARLTELRNKDQQLRQQYFAIQKQVEQSAEVLALKQAAEAAAAALAEAEAADQALAEARAAEQAAQNSLVQRVNDKLAAHAEAGPLVKQLAEIDEQRGDVAFRQAELELRLSHPQSPLNRALARLPELAALKAAADAAPKNARQEPLQKYQAARQAALAALPEGKQLLDEQQALAKQDAELLARRGKLQQQIGAFRLAVEKEESGALTAARQATQAALNAAPLAKLRAARQTAQNAVQNKVVELLNGQPEAKALRDEVNAGVKVINDLVKQLSAPPASPK